MLRSPRWTSRSSSTSGRQSPKCWAQSSGPWTRTANPGASSSPGVCELTSTPRRGRAQSDSFASTCTACANARSRGAASAPSPIDELARGDPLALSAPRSAPDLPGYVELALRGGFPDAALRLEGAGREQWLASYLDQIITRDAVDVSGRDPVRLARYFEALALNSAGIVADSTLFEAAAVDRKTAASYERLLANLFLLDVVPAWMTNRLSRLVKTPKRYITDPSLIGAALRVDVRAVMRDGGLLGRLLDTFVAAQIRSEVAVSSMRPRVFHLREKNGRHEIDLLAELGGDRVIAIEAKAAAAPNRSDAGHLEWLRDRLGDRFVAGVVVHTGPSAFALSERIAAVPIASLWSPPA